MNRFFNMDNGFFQVLSRIADLMIFKHHFYHNMHSYCYNRRRLDGSLLRDAENGAQ